MNEYIHKSSFILHSLCCFDNCFKLLEMLGGTLDMLYTWQISELKEVNNSPLGNLLLFYFKDLDNQ